MAETSKTGLLDLEKELNCSICTEVLYQPLTLLDCLHTFCGSCLKLWFSWQASQGSEYTCPSCRAVVRGTRPDAKITTLLEMFLQANPYKKKTEDEKKDIAAKYAPGDNVIPERRRRRAQAREDEENELDRRMVEEVREMSLRDGDRSTRTYERGARHRPRSREPRNGQSSGPPHGPGNRRTALLDSRSQARQIEHQSSLRSLISTDDVDSAAMEDEILRQILEEGLLDGIDTQNMSAMQEDELSERIAEAYRRRHGQLTPSRERRPRDARSPRRSAESTPPSRDRRSSPRPEPAVTQTSSPPSARETSSRLQVSQARAPESGEPRRASGERRRQTSPSVSSRQNLPGQPSPGQRSPRQHEAARSVTDLTDQASTRMARQRRLSDQGRHAPRSTELNPRPVDHSRARGSSATAGSAASQPRQSSDRPIPQQASSSPAQRISPRVQQRAPLTEDSLRLTTPAQPLIPPAPRRVSDEPRAIAELPAQNAAPIYEEPSITCDGCGRTQIQYELHENCSICKGGNYNLCHRCYRTEKGCRNWFGFGHLAWHRYQRQATQQDLPHTLVGRQWLKPPPDSLQRSTDPISQVKTTSDPDERRLSGAFCSICSSFADDCFWMCDWCNDGEWGYCTKCVNQGRCCSHPLLPIASIPASNAKPTLHISDAGTEASFMPLTSAAMVQTFPPTNLAHPSQYRPLTISTTCDVCHYPVQPSQSRHHCYQCAGGNYDICAPCYAQLVESGRISREHGDRGWRRCLRGHRTIVFFFEDAPVGQRRVVVRDLVGGHFLQDDREGARVDELEGRWRWLQDGGEQQTREVSWKKAYKGPGAAAEAADGPALPPFPPDGGVGMKLLAAYAWIPAEGVTNELSFPRGAEIREAMEVSDDWYLGSYAGAKGLFPSNYTKLMSVVKM